MLAEATLSSRIVGISDQRSQNLRIPGDKECALTYRTRPVADQLEYGLASISPIPRFRSRAAVGVCQHIGTGSGVDDEQLKLVERFRDAGYTTTDRHMPPNDN